MTLSPARRDRRDTIFMEGKLVRMQASNPRTPDSMLFILCVAEGAFH
jgi:hypothetical protein